MHKFKAGDRVRCNSWVGWGQIDGGVGTVIHETYSQNVLIQFDKEINGHAGEGIRDNNDRGKFGHCWWCRRSTVFPVKPVILENK